jgi:hypothetical protein
LQPKEKFKKKTKKKTCLMVVMPCKDAEMWDTRGETKQKLALVLPKKNEFRNFS